MAITGAERWNVTALLWSFGPPEQKDYVIERDEEMIGIIIEAGERFMTDHVNKRVPPDPLTSEQANLLWRRSTDGRMEPVTAEALSAVRELLVVKQERKASKARQDLLELCLKTHLEHAEASVDEELKPLITWKSQTSRRFAQKKFQEEHPALYSEFIEVSSYRVLRILKRGKVAAAMLPEETNDDQSD
jgi:predicted phage-related endonuclease